MREKHSFPTKTHPLLFEYERPMLDGRIETFAVQGKTNLISLILKGNITAFWYWLGLNLC